MITETWQIVLLIIFFSAPWIVLGYAIHRTEQWAYEMEHPNTKHGKKCKFKRK